MLGLNFQSTSAIFNYVKQGEYILYMSIYRYIFDSEIPLTNYM